MDEARQRELLDRAIAHLVLARNIIRSNPELAAKFSQEMAAFGETIERARSPGASA